MDLSAFCGSGTAWDAATFSCTTSGETSPLAAGLSTIFLSQRVDGVVIERRAQVHAPETSVGRKTYPVVLAFHGNGGTGDQFVSRLGPWVNDGDFVGVYPDGVAHSCNLGPEASNADDVEFVQAIAAELGRYTELDLDRLYAIGGSNGAGLVHQLAVETDVFRAIGAIVTPLLQDDAPTPGSKSMRVIQVLGTADHLIPYDGGTVGGGHGLPPNTEGGVEALIVDFFLSEGDGAPGTIAADAA